MADWKKIKTEYITTDTSYRKLAKKHGVSYQAICHRSKEEGWCKLREQHTNKTVSRTLDAISNKQVDRAANLIFVSDLLLGKVKSLLEDESGLPIDPQSMKHISGVLKDIKEIQMIRTDSDMREQEARIEKLRADAVARRNDDDDDDTGVILMPPVKGAGDDD